MKEARCLYCHRLILGVEILEDYPDVVILYAHTTCHAHDERTCPDCNNPLQPPVTLHIRPHGHVCEGCMMYYDAHLVPIAKIL